LLLYLLLSVRAAAPLAAWSLTPAVSQTRPAAAETQQQQQQQQQQRQMQQRLARQARSSSSSMQQAGCSKRLIMQMSARCGVCQVLKRQRVARMERLQACSMGHQQWILMTNLKCWARKCVLAFQP
jgi:uncharacterized protein YbbK (DUF523 family)